MGYINYSMSERAAAAYRSGEKPLTKWTKSAIIAEAESLDFKGLELLKKLTLQELRALVLRQSSWHHTGAKFNKTSFYSVSESALNELTPERVAEIVEHRQTAKQPEKQPEKLIERRARVRFQVWEKSSRFGRLKPRDVVEVVTLPASGLVDTSEGRKRRKKK